MNRGPSWPWFINAAFCIVAFFVLRLVFEIPFLITAVAVVVLSIAGSLLLTSASAPRVAQERDPTAPDGPVAAPRAEPFLLTETDLFEGRALSGFRLIPGESLGGGRFPRVPLMAGERVIMAVSGGHAGGVLKASLGYITLTDRRLVFQGERPFFDPFFFVPAPGMRELSLLYIDIEDVSLRKRFNLGMQLGSMRPAVVIQTSDGREHIFWPNLYDLEAFVARLR